MKGSALLGVLVIASCTSGRMEISRGILSTRWPLFRVYIRPMTKIIQRYFKKQRIDTRPCAVCDDGTALPDAVCHDCTGVIRDFVARHKRTIFTRQ